MLALDSFKKEWRELGLQLFDDLRLGKLFLEKAALQETFSSILALAALAVMRGLAKRGSVVKSGTSRNAQWALAPSLL
jgi:hypothetical protein